MQVKIKRGKEAALPVLGEGELALATDTKKVYVGTSEGNTPVSVASDVATTAKNGLMSAADKTKLNAIAANANNYVHPTTAGNKHIPTDGSAGQILKYSASGTAQWSANDADTVDGKHAADFVTKDSNGNVAITGNLTLKGTGNYGNKINFGDGDYVHIAEPADDTLELKGTRIKMYSGANEVFKIENSKAYYLGNELSSSGLKNLVDGNNTGAVRTTGTKSDYTMGQYAFAEGYSTTASGNYSHAGGYSTTASGLYSHAGGYSTTASGHYSHTEGNHTTASGYYSHAEGGGTTAAGECSHAGGFYTEAKSYERVIGHYSIVSTVTGNSTNTAGNAYIIGNGTSANARSNCFRVQYNGQVFSKGAYSTSGADYAELFEWEDGNPNNEDRRGLMVALHGDKIRIATSADDNIIGIISSNPAVIGNNHSETWQGMYLTDMWGDVLTEHKAFPAEYRTEEYTELDEDGQAVKRTRDILIHEAYETDVPIVNPDYNADEPYVPRHERKEWGLVGMFGQLIVKDDGTCEAGGYCQCVSDGMAGKADKGYYVMKRIANNYVLVLFR